MRKILRDGSYMRGLSRRNAAKSATLLNRVSRLLLGIILGAALFSFFGVVLNIRFQTLSHSETSYHTEIYFLIPASLGLLSYFLKHERFVKIRIWFIPVIVFFEIAVIAHLISIIYWESIAIPYLFVTCLLLIIIVWAIWQWPTRIMTTWRDRLEAKDYLTLENNFRTTILQILGGLVVIFGFYFTWQNSNIANETLRLSLRQSEDERFDKNLALLKEKDLEQRMIGIESLSRSGKLDRYKEEQVRKLFSRYLRKWSSERETSQNGISSIPVYLRETYPPIVYSPRSQAIRYLRKKSQRHSQFKPYHLSEIPMDIRALVDGLVALNSEMSVEVRERKPSASRADLSGINFSNLIVNSQLFYNFKMEFSSFKGSLLRFIEFEESDLSNADFSQTTLKYGSFSKCNLDKVDFRNSDLSAFWFYRSSLYDANFTGADIEGADMRTVEGLTAEQIKVAKNYDKAALPSELREQLGLPVEMPEN